MTKVDFISGAGDCYTAATDFLGTGSKSFNLRAERCYRRTPKNLWATLVERGDLWERLSLPSGAGGRRPPVDSRHDQLTLRLWELIGRTEFVHTFGIPGDRWRKRQRMEAIVPTSSLWLVRHGQ